MKPVTCWYKEIYNDKRKCLEYRYNHLEEYHLLSKKPVAKFLLQSKNWDKSNWKNTFAYLTKDNVVIKEKYVG